MMMLIYIFSALMPLVASVVMKYEKRLKYLSLIVVAPALLTLWDFASCKVTTLMEWYWMNCGLDFWQRMMVSLTMPEFLIPLASLSLALVGIKEERRDLMVLSSALALSVIFHWSTYLGINASMMVGPSKIPPIGYSVLRTYWFFIYLPLVTLALTIGYAYLITKKNTYLRIALVLSLVSWLPLFYWGLTAYGYPIIINSYFLSIILSTLLMIALLHNENKLAGLSLALTTFVPLGLYRAYTIGLGGFPSPFFGLQTSTAIAYLIIAIYSIYNWLRGTDKLYDKRFLIITVVGLALFVISLIDWANLIIYERNIAYISWMMIALAILISLNLSLVVLLKERDKVGAVGPISLLHPYAGLVASVGLTIYEARKDKFSALMTLSALLMALMLLYASQISDVIPYVKTTYNVAPKKVYMAKIYKYRGNVTAFEKHYLYNVNVSSPVLGKFNRTMKINYFVNVYLNKYIPPNTPSFYTWSEVYWVGLGTCTYNVRPILMPGGKAPLVRCAPLGTMAFLSPLVALATVIWGMRRR